jgi:hypothetical protein
MAVELSNFLRYVIQVFKSTLFSFILGPGEVYSDQTESEAAFSRQFVTFLRSFFYLMK